MDLDQLVQVLCFLHLVLKLQSCAVQNLSGKRQVKDYMKIMKFNLKAVVQKLACDHFPKQTRYFRLISYRPDANCFLLSAENQRYKFGCLTV